jgi:hypothetical protein
MVSRCVANLNVNQSSVPCLSGVHVAQSVVFMQCFVDIDRICSLSIVCLFFFDLRINYYLLLIYDPNLVQRTHQHNWTDMQFILAFIQIYIVKCILVDMKYSE